MWKTWHVLIITWLLQVDGIEDHFFTKLSFFYIEVTIVPVFSALNLATLVTLNLLQKTHILLDIYAFAWNK